MAPGKSTSHASHTLDHRANIAALENVHNSHVIGPQHTASSGLHPDRAAQIAGNAPTTPSVPKIDVACFKAVFNNSSPLFSRIVAALDKPAKHGRGSLKKIMEWVLQDLKKRPRKQQLSSNPLPSLKKLRPMCEAIYNMIPMCLFPPRPHLLPQKEVDWWHMEQDRFLTGVLGLLKADPVNKIKPVSADTSGPTRASHQHEKRASPIRPAIKQEFVDISMYNSDETSSDSSSGSDHSPPHAIRLKRQQMRVFVAHATTGELTSEPSTPSRRMAGKQKAVSPRVHESMERLDLDANEALPAAIHEEAAAGRKTKKNKKKAQETAKDRTKHRPAQKNKRTAAAMEEPDDVARPAKRQALQPTNAEEQDTSSSEVEEVKITQNRRGRRDPKEYLVDDLRQQLTFYKNMFLYGAGVSETDIMTYKIRVTVFHQDHKTAWKTLMASSVARGPADGTVPNAN